MDAEKLEENLKYALDRYGEFADRKQLLEMEKQKLISSILTPEQLTELDAINFEFESKEKALDEKEKEARKYLNYVLSQYAESLDLLKNEKRIVKGSFAKVSVEEGDVIYDPVALDGYAINHPEILGFRTQTKKKTRVTLNKEIRYEKE